MHFLSGRPGATLGTGFVIVSAVSFGVITTLGRLAYDGGSNPATVVLLRMLLFVAVIGAVLLLLRRRWRLDARVFAATLWMAVALLMMSLGYLGSVAFIPVSLAALILYSFPLMVGVIAALSGRDRMTTVRALALLTAFVGLALALGSEIGSLDWRGVAAACVAALGTALIVTFGGEAVRGQDTLVVNFYTNLWAAMGLGAYVAVTGGFALPQTSLGAAATIGVCVSYVVAFVTWFLAFRFIEPVRVAGLFNIEPLVSIAAAVVLLGETLAPPQMAGAVLVLGAILAVAMFDRKPAERPARIKADEAGS